MLRRAIKRSKIEETQEEVIDVQKVKRPKKREKALGEKPEKDEAEKVLEQLVIGDDGEMLDKLGEGLSKQQVRLRL